MKYCISNIRNFRKYIHSIYTFRTNCILYTHFFHTYQHNHNHRCLEWIQTFELFGNPRLEVGGVEHLLRLFGDQYRINSQFLVERFPRSQLQFSVIWKRCINALLMPLKGRYA